MPLELENICSYFEYSPQMKDLCHGIDCPISPILYNDIIEDIANLSGKDDINDLRPRYYCISSMSSCYRKHTQSAASQANPVFKFSFTDKTDKRINLIEFTSESEYWIFCREFNRAATGRSAVAEGVCIFTSNSSGGGSGTANKWFIDKSSLKVVDQRNGLTYFSPIENMKNPQFKFDYRLPERSLDLHFLVDNDEAYFTFKALVSFENASLDPRNPVEAVLSIGREKTITVPIYTCDEAPKMRVRVIESSDKKNTSKEDDEESGIIQSFGETAVVFQDTSIPTLSIARNFTREQSQTAEILIKPPQHSRRSIQVLIHSASEKVQVYAGVLNIISTHFPNF
jgi:hypothetical protein